MNMENNNSGFTFDLPKGNSSIIKVIGVGGGGNNALKHMYERGIHGVDFVICNTDAQTLNSNPVSNKVQLGVSITEGLGAGADPEVGEKAAIESIDDIKSALGQNTKMVFITAGMGGGTGTGAAPVVAKIAKEMGILTVAIVTVPFAFEGKRRVSQAEAGLEKLRENVDSLIVINNDKLRQQFGNLGFKQGFSKADEVLTNAAKGMAEVITAPFQINIDFRDAKSVLQNSGTALMSTGIATGEKRAEEAVRKALDSPLLNDSKITGAKDVLLLILSGSDEAHEATMDEIGLINDYVQNEAGGDNEANIIFGVGTDDELGDAIKVLVIATGFSNKAPAKNEKIVLGLGEQNAQRKPSPFDRTSVASETSSSVNESGKNVFKLDDHDEPSSTGITMSTTPSSSAGMTQSLAYENEVVEVYGDYQDENIIHSDETLSFGFDYEEKEENKPFVITEEEKPISFTFTVADSEPMVFETEEKEAQNTTEAQPNLFSTIEKETPKVETEVPPQVEQIIEEKHEGFTFISKSNESKIMERRRKLEEFNSRYQVDKTKDDFESTPSFRRKNIQIEGLEEPSSQQVNTYLREDHQGNTEIRQNRFLNRDVD